ncbi:FAD-dependent oxidoreductase [Pseudomonas oryzae]|uniref:NADH dehydrogenase, FAD-containing subunit n=1 Tax=Pseudomonas oryzae TaxID=1392877 RepID=A0A1H1XKL4_9PSED|nr:FAD-dependent oxidoreductase [Pseudomonas oryzae]SDT09703.1 NADH dehydrogenase, FAD-containing subunit [Pseudomonas oryzae]
MPNPDLLLVGAGHSHLGVLRRWARGERPPGRLLLLSDSPHAWYAGRVPALLAGRLRASDCRIDLAPLCRAAGVELLQGTVTALDADRRELQLADGSRLQAGWLSLDVGAAPPLPQQHGAGMQVVAVKPFAGLLECWRQWQADPQPLALVGGGVAGVELALALAGQVPQLSLFSAGPLLDGHSPGLRMRAHGLLRQLGVHCREHCPISHIDGDTLYSEAGAVWHGPRLLLASGNQPLPWLADSGLACAEDGFIEVDATLQSRSHPRIFASGDCASLTGAERNAWQAMRQAPRLAANLAASLQQRPLQRYRAPRQSLLLLTTGDGGALLDWRGWSAGGRLCGWWREQRDRQFMLRHQL